MEAQTAEGFDTARITQMLEAGDESCLQPIVRKAAESFYDQVLGMTQDYLMSNLDFNLKSHVAMLETQNARMQKELYEISGKLGRSLSHEQKLDAIDALDRRAMAGVALLDACRRLDAFWLADWEPPHVDPDQQEERILSKETLDVWRTIRAAIAKSLPAAVVQPQHPSHDGQAQSASPNGDDAREFGG